MIWKRLFRRLNEPELDEELEFHLGMKERALVAQGMSPAEARVAARRAMGNTTLAREDSRAAWSFAWLSDTGRDLRYGWRALAAQPGFAVAAVLALVLGIGVNAILFNIYNALALTPWAVRDAGAVVRVFQGGNGSWEGMSWPAFRYLRDHSQTARVTAYDTNSLQVAWKEATWKVNAVEAEEGFFDVLGTGFAAGRGFSPASGNSRNPTAEVILHYDEWQSRFGGDRGVIGQWIDVNGRRLQIVGVAVQGFSGPVPISPNLWVPASWHDILHSGNAMLENPDNCCAKVAARLNDATGAAAAQAELDTLLGQFNADHKRDATHILLTKLTLLAEPRNQGQTTPAFAALGMASFLILLLACANVGNLQLARGASRSREFAVRVSLGASRSRILRQLLVEACLLSGMAGLLTALLSSWAPTAIMNWFAANTDANGRLNFTFANDWRVTLAVTGLSLLATLLFGLVPAMTTARSSVTAGLQQGGRSTSHNRLRKGLLAAQIVLCTVLLSGASLLVRALVAAQNADPGFAAARLVVLTPNLDSSGAPDAQTKPMLAAVLEQAAALPGVQQVTHAVVVPLGRRNDSVGIELPGTRQHITFAHNRVGAQFFEVMGVPMVAGRNFTAADETRNDSMIINESLARKAWPDASPLGKPLLDGRIVVGVVRDFSIREIGPGGEAAAFVPATPSRDSQIIVRRRDGVPSTVVAEQILKLARGTDKHLAMAASEPYAAIVDRSREASVMVATVAGVMSSLSLVLACLGIYGVAAYSVTQRTREIGLRMALGAKRAEILQMMLGDNLRVVTLGAGIGLVGAFLFGRLLTSMLYGVKPGDPLALLASIGILLLTAGAAAWIPARRAAAVDPAITLRHD